MNRTVSLAIGVVAVLTGILLTLRPFASLSALALYVALCFLLAGAGELAATRGRPDAVPERVAGALLILTGLLAGLAPGLTVAAMATVIGLGLILSGVARAVAGVRDALPERLTTFIAGVSSVIFGLLVLLWPDVTVLVIALLTGPVVIVAGARLVWRALRGPAVPARASRPRHHEPIHPWLRALRATGALVLGLLLLVISAAINSASPRTTSFYAPPRSLPASAGVLLRSEPTTRGIPAGARGLRILYTTTGPDGRIVTASGLVVVGARASGSRPVLLWEHGTTGVAVNCAPSLLPDPFTAGAMPALAQVLARGWAVVAPDYLGLGTAPPHPYLVGYPAAHSSLDAVRAARQLHGLALGPRTVVWGHSQGGGAALWTGYDQHKYASDVPLSGVVALAPASDLPALARRLARSPGGMLFATFLLEGYAAAYPDVHVADYVRASARTVVARVVGRCLSEPATLLSLPAVLTGERLFTRGLDTGPLRAHLAKNVPDHVDATPTLIAQGLGDELVLPAVQRAFAVRLCRAGQQLQYRTYAGRDHVGVVSAGSPLIPYLLSWTAARFAGRRVADNCAALTAGAASG